MSRIICNYHKLYCNYSLTEKACELRYEKQADKRDAAAGHELFHLFVHIGALIQCSPTHKIKNR